MFNVGLNFPKPYRCITQSLKAIGLRDRDETWNLRGRDSQKWVSTLETETRSRDSITDISQCCQLVYFQSAWYINFWFGISEKFGIFLLKGLVKTLNQIICYIVMRKQRKHSILLKLYQEKLNDFAQHGSKCAVWVSGEWNWKRAGRFLKNWT